MIYGVGNEFTDFSANLDQQRLIGGTVVAVDFADVFAVGDLAGEGFRVVADVGGERVEARLDSRLCQDNRRIDPECFPRLSGEGKEGGKKFALLHFFSRKVIF